MELISVLIIVAVISIIAGFLGGILLTGGFQDAIIGIIIAIVGFVALCVIAPKAIERIIDIVRRK